MRNNQKEDIMDTLREQISAFLSSRTTSSLCKLWCIANDHYMSNPYYINMMTAIENELQRRYPDTFNEWICCEDEDWERFCHPQDFFTISVAKEISKNPNLRI